MRPLQIHYLDVHDRCMELRKEKELGFHDGLFRYLLSSADQSAHIGLIGRHWLTGNSEGNLET